MTTMMVTGSIIDMGDVVIENAHSELVRLQRAVVVQFETVDEFKRAIAGIASVRLEWRTDLVEVRSE